MPNLKLGIVGLPNVGKSTLFYRTVADGREPRPVASLPVLPIVGMRWRF